MNNLDGKESCHVILLIYIWLFQIESNKKFLHKAFVDCLGLAVLFPLFMKPVKISKKKKGNNYNNEEHIVSIIASLLKNCSGSNKQRVLQKFVENDHEKIDRLLELFFKYSEEVAKADAEIMMEKSETDDDDDENDEIKSENYMKRLESGLFALQSISYIILDISENGPSSIKNRVLKLLNLRKIEKSKIIEIIKEYEENLGEAHEENIKNSESLEEHERIKELISKF
jgi:beta-catenin-like protein 1